jgi:hypothetical protein
MADPTQAALHFLPWVRQGAAGAISTVDTLGPNQPAAALMQLKLRVNNADVNLPARLYGPGDVLAIDSRQVVRTDPRNRAGNFEPNYFPAIEFDNPDFPWLFTPAGKNANDQLRPWICLIVVRKQSGVTLRGNSGGALPFLEIKSPATPADELPNLGESWAWAHAQVSGTVADTSPDAALKSRPDLTVSRLICPRRLQPRTGYFACVVPAFEIGLKVGLGLPVTEQDERQLLPSWRSGAQSPPEITLPVYYSWEFRTGELGDFESLVSALKPRKLDSKVGRRELDISDPGYRISGFTGATVELEAALCPFDAMPPSPLPTGFQPAIQKVLNDPSATAPRGVTDPLVGPPIYGDRYAQRDSVDDTANPPGWLNELNLDPRHRVAAGLGTLIVQHDQEQLMASAWDQLEKIKPINQALRQTQLAVAASAMIHKKHFRAMPIDALLQITAPSHQKILLNQPSLSLAANPLTLKKMFVESKIPERAVSVAMRRIVRPRGELSRRFPVTLNGVRIARPIISRLNGTLTSRLSTPGIITIDAVSEAANNDKILYDNASVAALEETRTRVPFKIEPEGAKVPAVPPPEIRVAYPENPIAASFRSAALAHQTYLMSAIRGHFSRRSLYSNQTTLQASLLERLNPANNVTAAFLSRTNLPASVAQAGEPPTQVMGAPEFPQPMYEALRDLSPDYILPGLEHVPPNTVALLAANRRYIEAFMIGLNHEMGRELLWREYPTDQRNLYFRQFWDTRFDAPDIRPLREWKNTDPLGAKYTGKDDHLVLLIRGELLERYPGAVIYAAEAVRDQSGRLIPGTKEKHPIFRGTMQPDVTFLGFDLTRVEARGTETPGGKPGWFLVIKQQPGEPRFGLDEASGVVTTKPAKWSDVSWGHVASSAAQFQALQHVRLNPGPLVNHAIGGVKWGANAAHMASITLQKPMRIAIHARQMILD